jgi:hypothetical protein
MDGIRNEIAEPGKHCGTMQPLQEGASAIAAGNILQSAVATQRDYGKPKRKIGRQPELRVKQTLAKILF